MYSLCVCWDHCVHSASMQLSGLKSKTLFFCESSEIKNRMYPSGIDEVNAKQSKAKRVCVCVCVQELWPKSERGRER